MLAKAGTEGKDSYVLDTATDTELVRAWFGEDGEYCCDDWADEWGDGGAGKIPREHTVTGDHGFDNISLASS